MNNRLYMNCKKRKNTRMFFLCVLLIIVLFYGLSVTAFADDEYEDIRVSGSDRYGTAQKVFELWL